MLKYVLAAQALRFFSINGATKKLYRSIGNARGGNTRSTEVRPHYIQRANNNLSYLEKYGAIADGQSVLELGTGWVHWEALFTRLFYDVRFTLFDVWDNRQFPGFQFYCRELRRRLANEVNRPEEQLRRAEALLDEIAALSSFEAVYERLGFRYIINPTGALDDIGDQTLDLIISSDVLEHVPAQAVPTLLTAMFRVLKPGGISAHQIVPADHLVIYDSSASGKQYLRYSDTVWRAFFQNDVQYFNRIQHSEWVDGFKRHGFEILCDEITAQIDISNIKVNERFRHLPQSDLEGTVSQLLARHPA